MLFNWLKKLFAVETETVGVEPETRSQIGIRQTAHDDGTVTSVPVYEGDPMFSSTNIDLKKGCPDCGQTDKWLAGPSGGMSQNYKCGVCQSKFNVMPDGWAERI